MATNFFKGSGKKAQKVETPVPRKMEEIKADYENLRNRSGDLQYQIHVLKNELSQVNAVLINLNNEAAARNDLNKKEEKQ